MWLWGWSSKAGETEGGFDSPLVILNNRFHVAKEQDPSWEMTNEEFSEINIVQSLGEQEEH